MVNQFMRWAWAFLILIALVQCRSFFEGVGTAMAVSITMPFLIISGEVSTITTISIAHKDSTGEWPKDKKELSSFNKKEGIFFPRDTLFQHLEFNEANFETLEFRELDDTLVISFNTIPIPDSAYLPLLFPESKPSAALSFCKYVGLAKLYPDSISAGGYETVFSLESITQYNSNMEEIDYFLSDSKINSIRSRDKN